MKTILATAFLLGAMSSAAFALPSGVSPNGDAVNMTVNMTGTGAKSYSVDAGAYTLSLDGTEQTSLFLVNINGSFAAASGYQEIPGSLSSTALLAPVATSLGLNNYDTATEITKLGQMEGLLRNYMDNSDATSSAATQLALWAIEYETGTSGYDISTAATGANGFWVAPTTTDSQAISDADNLLTDVNNGTFEPMDTTPVTFDSGYNENKMLVQAVPEPSTYAIMAVGLLGMIGVYRRKMV
jgi:hypothetical protein